MTKLFIHVFVTLLRSPPDLFEVGVHIADVAYFVLPGSALDREAAERTTSVYLVQKVNEWLAGWLLLLSCCCSPPHP